MEIPSTLSLAIAACVGVLMTLVVLLPTLASTRRQTRLQLAASAQLVETNRALQELGRRHMLAQHWARGGLLSEASEGWRPLLTALSLVAVTARDIDTLDRVLRELVGELGSGDPQLANIARQALGELEQARKGEGLALNEAQEWPWPALATRSAELLAQARTGAEHLVRLRSYPPPSGT